jgi:Family of unknown function (DUF6525)
MQNNTHDAPIFRGRKPDSYYLDRLPAGARRALNEAKFDWASGAFYRLWRRRVQGYRTEQDLVERVHEADADQIARERKGDV